MIFHKNTNTQFKNAANALLNMPHLGDISSYLGIPFSLTRNQKHLFKPLLYKIALKMSAWSKKLLSNVGRFIMIKYVLQALPLHQMACIKLPKLICLALLANPLSKEIYGGLGLRQFALFNMTLLVK